MHRFTRVQAQSAQACQIRGSLRDLTNVCKCVGRERNEERREN